MTSDTAPPTPVAKKTGVFKVLGATLVGTSIEWYDFALFGFMSATIFPRVFFPDAAAGEGILGSFAIFAVGSLMRPVGAALFGHIGDSIGRKRALLLSLGLMTVSTVLIGLVPDFRTLGWVAVVLLLLLRIVQSLAVGGEWGGAVTYAVEAAPRRWRALFGSFPQIGNSIGLFLATGIVALVGGWGDEEWLAGIGWRIPFWLAGLLGIIGIWMRLIINETQAFQEEVVATGKVEEKGTPLVELFRNHGGLVFRVAGACLVVIGGYYISINYVQSYATNHLEMPDAEAAGITSLVSIIIVGMVIVSGVVGSIIGVRRFTLIGLFLHIPFAIPMFWFMSQGGFSGIFMAMFLGQIAGSMAYATIGTMVSGWFPTEVRQSGLSLGYQISGVVGSGTLLFAQWLDTQFGENIIPVALLFLTVSLTSWLCVLTFRQPVHLEGTEGLRSARTGELKVGVEGDTIREMPAILTEAEIAPDGGAHAREAAEFAAEDEERKDPDA